MSEPTDADPRPPMKVKTLRCRRTGQTFSVAEHVECPYCSGDAHVIETTGDYKKFCEFKAGEDPINFGFDPDSSRHQSG